MALTYPPIKNTIIRNESSFCETAGCRSAVMRISNIFVPGLDKRVEAYISDGQ